jgi:hypothetical protein
VTDGKIFIAQIALCFESFITALFLTLYGSGIILGQCKENKKGPGQKHWQKKISNYTKIVQN